MWAQRMMSNVAILGSRMFNSAVGVAAAAVCACGATTQMTTAHADDDYQQFASPSGSIRCILNGQNARLAMCQIGDHTYAVEPGTARDQNGGLCPPGSDLGRDFRLDQGQPAYVTCTYSAIGSGSGAWPPLAYGQTRSLGTLSCDSEPAGITCTDSGTGHFFRVSRESYELG
jgi:hypothetical protein